MPPQKVKLKTCSQKQKFGEVQFFRFNYFRENFLSLRCCLNKQENQAFFIPNMIFSKYQKSQFSTLLTQKPVFAENGQKILQNVFPKIFSHVCSQCRNTDSLLTLQNIIPYPAIIIYFRTYSIPFILTYPQYT
jgi:hypothetical protein